MVLPSCGSDILCSGALKENDPTVGRYVELTETAKAICKETGLDLHAALEALCGLTLTHCMPVKSCGPTISARQNTATVDGTSPEPDGSLDLNMLAAAAHLNLLPLARHLLAKGQSPLGYSHLFAPPIQVAAQVGNIDILKLFREWRPNNVRAGFWARKGAAIRGELSVVQAAVGIYAQMDKGEDANKDDYPLGIIDSPHMRKNIADARRFASSPEVYEYLTDALVPEPPCYGDKYVALVRQSGLGNSPMVRYLLGIGVPVEMAASGNPLLSACRGHHNDVVDVLLEHGADPNFATNKTFVSLPLHEGATASNLAFAQIFVSHGALINRPECGRREYPALFSAFARENETMIRLLLEAGATFDATPRPSIWRSKQGQNW
jgi:hypothetical protein